MNPKRSKNAGSKHSPVGASHFGSEAAHSCIVRLPLRLQVIDAETGRPMSGERLASISVNGAQVRPPKLSDEHGVFEIPIPINAARGAAFRLEVSFADLRVVAEATHRELDDRRRSDGRHAVHRGMIEHRGGLTPHTGPPARIVEGGDETVTWWCLDRSAASDADLQQWPAFDFHAAWSDLPGSAAAAEIPPGDWSAIGAKTRGYSAFVGPEAAHPHLVLLGLSCPACDADLTSDQCAKIFPTAAIERREDFRRAFNRCFKRFDLNRCSRKAHFFAQVMEELGPGLLATTESFNYSAAALMSGKPFKYFSVSEDRREEATRYGRVPSTVVNHVRVPGHAADWPAIANRVYAGKNGNGDVASGDGWRYRGGGCIQLTGRGNYAAVQAVIDRKYPASGVNIVDGAESIDSMESVVCSGLGFWSWKRLNVQADRGMSFFAVDEVTQVVNQGTTTYGDRQAHFSRVSNLLSLRRCPRVINYLRNLFHNYNDLNTA